MLRNKKLVGLFCFMIIALVLTACGGGNNAANNEGNKNDTGTAEGTPAPAATEGPKYNFRLAETHPADYPTTKGDMKFAELVKEKSDGRITIDVFPSAQLGEEKSAIEQVQLGAIEFTRVSSSPLGEFNKEFGVFSLPYIFDNDEHVWKFLLGDAGMKLLDSLESSRLKGLGYYTSGARSFYSEKPLKTLEDLKGLKIRVQENQLNIAMIDALGASATPMPYGEVYSALQTGVIDGAENNYPSYFSSKHYEVAKNYILDGHQRVPEVLMMSKTAWDKLSPEDQAIIKEAALESITFQREEWAKYEKVSEEQVRAAGATITEVTDVTPWQEAVKPIIDANREQYKTILDAIDAAR
ncbi:TRAP transporter substrate-binding protein [Paenibacillus sp. LHD-38]|uniref:TRAP transporter substrate-binding protein n=1 Tax=Paenibacillus sp. LHD-38 TaxID=3072143 RepID=UPI0028100C07|nr:TRAP transporter substrate-binding protein [Paenibacillus sp. LHD-38]MDQ8737255.1 TRAP transporter substrate-binding protein [Paenibacillus sp. LHD-38]